jgi:hypothetical protein
MPIHYTGRNIIASLLLGFTPTPYLATTGAVMWVGSGTAAHDPLDNHLKGSSVAATMLSGYPINSPNNRMTFRGLYATNIANFEWQEWGIKNSTGTATSTAGSVYMLQRKQESLGTKASTQQWQLTVDLDITT